MNSRASIIDEFCKLNPMPERTYCKEAYKIENITLNFKHEYTKSLEVIEELDENGVNTDQYITEESRKKYELAELEQEKKFFEHCSKCDNPYCQWAFKRDSFLKSRISRECTCCKYFYNEDMFKSEAQEHNTDEQNEIASNEEICTYCKMHKIKNEVCMVGNTLNEELEQ